MSEPVRVQLSRQKGWRMPPNTVKVDRTTKWGNPHDWRDWLEDARAHSWALQSTSERQDWCKERAAQAFREDAADGLLPDLAPLRGKNLACWCRLTDRHTCHADVLLELANATTPSSKDTPIHD